MIVRSVKNQQQNKKEKMDNSALISRVAELEEENQKLRKVAEKAASERAFAWETLALKSSHNYTRLAEKQEHAEMMMCLWRKKSKKLQNKVSELDNEIKYQHGKLWETLIYFGKVNSEHKETIKEIWEITDDLGWATDDSDEEDSDEECSDSDESDEYLLPAD